MKAYYEQIRENDSTIIIRRNDDYSFAPHFHLNVEVLILKKGRCEVLLNGESITVEDGTVVFLDSYDIHGFKKIDIGAKSDSCVVVIPNKYLQRFTAIKKGRRLCCSVKKDERLCDNLLEIVDKLLKENKDGFVRESAIDLFLALILESFGIKEESIEDERSLIMSILSYINANYRGDLSLAKISENFGYTEEHVSRTFHRYMKTGIPKYINALRLDFVQNYMANNPDKKITEAIFEAGFKSMQSYYRNKLDSFNK